MGLKGLIKQISTTLKKDCSTAGQDTICTRRRVEPSCRVGKSLRNATSLEFSISPSSSLSVEVWSLGRNRLIRSGGTDVFSCTRFFSPKIDSFYEGKERDGVTRTNCCYFCILHLLPHLTQFSPSSSIINFLSPSLPPSLPPSTPPSLPIAHLGIANNHSV